MPAQIRELDLTQSGQSIAALQRVVAMICPGAAEMVNFSQGAIAVQCS
jgi:hypothetical protein